MAVCAECGQNFLPDNVVAIQGVTVCGGCKPGYLKRLQEGSAAAGGFQYKGFWTRFVAKFVDGLITQVAGMLIGVAVGVAAGGNQSFAVVGIEMLIGLVIGFSYPIFFNGRYGATPGKMMIGARIVNADGTPISYAKAAGRAFSEILSALTLLFGYMMAGWDPQKRALHDRICGTIVIQK